MKEYRPKNGVSAGTLYFGHSGNHYVALKRVEVRNLNYFPLFGRCRMLKVLFDKICFGQCYLEARETRNLLKPP